VRRTPHDVIPSALGNAVRDLTTWFVIGGHAVRCFCPYRPTRDVDFGVVDAKSLTQLLRTLERRGTAEIFERSTDTVHLRWNGIDVSIFELAMLAPFTEGQTLTVEGILATKVHAILDRGTRRDFFDLYVTLQHHRLGIIECLSALRRVYKQKINDGLLLRAMTYFDDAEREAPLPGEKKNDWAIVKDFFISHVGHLLVPPRRVLGIQANVVDVAPNRRSRAPTSRKPRR
jgi:hypothetical protein